MESPRSFSSVNRRTSAFRTHSRRIVIVAFLCAFVYSGFGIYAFGLFVGPIEAETQWNRASISVAFTAVFIIVGLSSTLTGKALDRYSTRGVVTVGALLAAAGFSCLSTIRELWQFYASYVLVGVGLAAMGLVPATTLVSRWFIRGRGTMLGIALTGVGAGGLVTAPLVGGYLIPVHGWRVAYLAMAGVVWALVPLFALITRSRPQDVGTWPDGAEARPDAGGQTPSSPPLELPPSTSARRLASIMLVFFLTGLASVGTLVTHTPFLTDVGATTNIAAASLALLSVCSLSGKFFFGRLSDAIGPTKACTLGVLLQLAAILVLSVLSTNSAAVITLVWPYAILLGLGIGSREPTMSTLVSSIFGTERYGEAFGLVVLAYSIGAALGPLIAGYAYDIKGTYSAAFAAFAGFAVVSIALLVTLHRAVTSARNRTA